MTCYIFLNIIYGQQKISLDQIIYSVDIKEPTSDGNFSDVSQATNKPVWLWQAGFRNYHEKGLAEIVIFWQFIEPWIKLVHL